MGQEAVIVELSVTDKAQKPIDNAYVIETSQNSFIGTTDKGKLLFEQENLPQKITISHLSYQNKIIELTSSQIQSDTIKLQVQLVKKVFELKEVEIAAQQNNLAYQRKQDNVEDYEFYGDDILLLLQAGKRNKLRLINELSQTIYDLTIPDKAINLIRDCFDNLHVIYKDSIFQVRFTDAEIYLMPPFAIREYERTLKRCEAALNGGFIIGNYSLNGFETDLYLKPPEVDTFLFLQKNIDWVAQQKENYFVRSYNGLGTKSSASTNNQDELSRLRALDYAYTYFKHVESKPIYNPVFTLKGEYLLFNHHQGYVYYYNKEGSPLKRIAIEYSGGNDWKDYLMKDYSEERVYGLFKKGSKRYIKEVNYEEGSVSDNPFKIEHAFSTNLQIRNGYLYYLYRGLNQSNAPQQLFKFKL